MIEHLRKVADALRTKIEGLRTPLEQAEKDLEHIVGVIDFYSRNTPTQEAGVAGPAVTVKATITPNLRGLSQKQAVIAIARFNGGVIKAQHAKRLMIEAGVMSNTKNSTRMVHNAIINSERFDRIAPGEFRLKAVSATLNVVPSSGTPVAASAAGLFPPKPPVQ
jgi:hypothetical protein